MAVSIGRLGSQPLWTPRRTGSGEPDHRRGARGTGARRHRRQRGGWRLAGQPQRRFRAGDLCLVAGAAGRRWPALGAGHAGGKRLRFGCCRAVRGLRRHRGRARPGGPGGGRRKDDGRGWRRDHPHPRQRFLRERRSGAGPDLPRHLCADGAGLFRTPRRPVGSAGPHRGQEPRQRRAQPLGPDAARPRLRVLQHRVGQEPDGRGALAQDRLLAGVRRRCRRAAGRRIDGVALPACRDACARVRRSTTSCPCRAATPLAFEGPRRAWAKALAGAGCGVNDLSLAEVHDCFTIAELLAYEAMGLARPGQVPICCSTARCCRAGGCRSTRRAASKPRATRSAPPACRSTCWLPCSSWAKPARCRCRAPSWRACSTWAGRPWPATSASWSARDEPGPTAGALGARLPRAPGHAAAANRCCGTTASSPTARHAWRATCAMRWGWWRATASASS